MRGLDELGVFAGYHDGTPWHRASRTVHRVRSRRGRRDPLWMLRPEMRVLAAMSDAARRARPPCRPDAWVQPLGPFGLPMPGRVAVMVDVTPAQLVQFASTWSRSFWPCSDERTFRALVRQQTRVVRRADVCCAASTWAAASLVEDHGVDPARVHVVGFGPNVATTSSDRCWDTPRFLFVGRDWPRKNGDMVLRAFARVRAVHRGARLDVVGAHPAIDVEGAFTHGELTAARADHAAELSDLYRRATCFVLPSHFEPFGIAYVEAAAAGVPSIGTTVGGARDAIGDGGVLVDPDDEDALVDAMLRLSDPATAQMLGARALARSAAFTWRAVAERIVDALAVAPVVVAEGSLALAR